MTIQLYRSEPYDARSPEQESALACPPSLIALRVARGIALLGRPRHEVDPNVTNDTSNVPPLERRNRVCRRGGAEHGRPSRGAARQGNVLAGINVDLAATCVAPAPPSDKVKSFSSKTGAKTVRTSYSGTVTDPADALDVTKVSASSKATARTVSAKGSLRRLSLSAKVSANMKSAQGSASDCDTELRPTVRIEAVVKVKKRGPMTITWDRAPQGYITNFRAVGEAGELNAFYLQLETGGHGAGKVRRTVPGGKYMVVLEYLTFLDSDGAKPGITRKRSSTMKMNVSYR